MNKKIILGIIVMIVIIISSIIVIAPYWFATETGLVLHMTCDGDFTDRASSYNTEQSGGVKIGTGAKGRGCVFDGEDTFINTTISNRPVNFTICSWIYPISNPAWGCIASLGYDTAIGWDFHRQSDGSIILYARNGTTPSGISGGTTNLHEWTHVCAAYINTTTSTTIYVNGKDVGATGANYNISYGNTNFIIGSRKLTPNLPFNGTIDEVRLYNTSLTAAEIYTLYNSSKSYKLVFKSYPTLGFINETPAPTMFNETPEPTITDETELVGYWKFNTNALDSSGESNDGTISGGGGVANTTGRWNGAYSFDGDDSYVNIGDQTELSFTNNTFAIAFWIKANNTADTLGVLGKRGSPWEYSIHGIGSNFQFHTWNSAGNGVYQISSGITYDTNWNHFVWTANGTQARLYKQGILIDTTNKTAKNMSDTNRPFEIGRSGDAGGLRYWNGIIDEVRIYNRSLSESEVLELYLSKGLVGHWSFDSADGSDSLISPDISGYNNSGTVSGATFTTAGRWKEGYEFDGLTDNNDYIDVPHSLEIDIGRPNTNFTVSAWAYADGYKGRYSGIVAKRVGGPTKYWQFAVDNNSGTITAFFYGYNGTTALQDLTYSDPPTNEWFMITVSCERTTINGCKLYQNAVLKDQTTVLSTFNMSNTGNMYIGREAANANTWDGKIDEVKIFRRALTGSEITELYRSKGLVGHWTFDSRDGSNSAQAKDISGYNNNGTVSSATFTNEGRFKEGYTFDGTDDYLFIPHSAAINISGELTVSGWVKTVDMGAIQRIINKGNVDAGTPGIGWEVEISAADKFSMRVNNKTGGGGVALVEASLTTDCFGGSCYNKWFHFATTWNLTQADMYINGVLIDSSNSVAQSFNYYNTLDMYIGERSGAAGQNFNGTLDEIKIYNRALSASEIAGMYNGTKSNKFVFKSFAPKGILNETPAPALSDESGLVGHWKFNTDMLDSSDEGNDGTISNDVINSSGRWNEAYYFQGGSGYITTNPAIDALPITVSLWSKQIDSDTWSWLVEGKASSTAAYGLVWDGDGLIEFKIFNSTGDWVTSTNGPDIQDNKWHHIVGMANTTHIMVYVDGVLGSSNTHAITMIDPNLILIGGNAEVGRYNGTIDEVRIYNRTLSLAEIKELYQTKGLVGHWTFDTKDGSNSAQAKDISGYNNNGTVSGAVFTNEGRFKEGYVFDGDSDLINLGNDITAPSLNLTNNFTISGWVKINENSSQNGLIIGGFDYSDQEGYRFITTSTTDKFVFQSGNGTDLDSCIGDNKYILGQWYHIATTINDGTIKLYENGVEQSCTGIFGGNIVYDFTGSGTDFQIGGTSANWMNGTIDEVKIFNRALTSAEVAGLYNGTKSTRLVWRSVPG